MACGLVSRFRRSTTLIVECFPHLAANVRSAFNCAALQLSLYIETGFAAATLEWVGVPPTVYLRRYSNVRMPDAVVDR